MVGDQPRPDFRRHPIEYVQSQAAGPFDAFDIRRRVEPNPVFFSVFFLEVFRIRRVLSQTALFVFEPASTGAWIVPIDLECLIFHHILHPNL
jgi:hypothetical protein